METENCILPARSVYYLDNGTLALPSKRKSDVAFQGLSCSIESGRTKLPRFAEKLRRNRMRYLCAKLESLIPSTVPKIDRCGVFKEASNYIRRLQDEIYQLKGHGDNLLAKQKCGETEKESRELTKVDVEVYGREVIIIICSSTRARCFSKLIEEVEKHGLEVHMSQFSTSEFFAYLHFHAMFRDDIKEHKAVELQSSLQRRLLLAY